jgi:DnaJ like chaperone protein
MASLLVLVAAVMNADGVVRRSELDYVKGYLLKTFDEDSARDAVRMLRDILNQEIPVNEVCAQIAANLDYSSRLQLLHFLFGISNADSELHPAELAVIEDIAQRLALEQPDYRSLRAMFVGGIENAYQTLGLQPDSTAADIKKAYRDLANKYHPDKVAYLGDEFKLAAQEKFQKLNEAYAQLKRERGFV